MFANAVCVKPLPLFKLQQQKQLDKHEETIAIPTARNFDTIVEQADQISKQKQIEATVIGDVDVATKHIQHKINAERLLSFTKAKQNLNRLADMKKSNIDDITPNFIQTSEKKRINTKSDSVSSVRPLQLQFENCQQERSSNFLRPVLTPNLKQQLTVIHEQSPFRILAQSDTQSTLKNDPYKSFQSEDILDTIDVDNKKRDRLLQNTAGTTQASHPQNIMQDQNQPSISEQLKVFSLKLDNEQNNRPVQAQQIQETQFDSIDWDQLQASSSRRGISSRTHTNDQSKDDSVFVEKELIRINQNLNQFTFEEFQQLRQKIKLNGFNFGKVNDKTTEISVLEDLNVPSAQMSKQQQFYPASKSLGQQIDSEAIKNGLGQMIVVYTQQNYQVKPTQLAKVQISGFCGGCPRFIFKDTSGRNKAVPNQSDEIILPKLLTSSILRSFVGVKIVSCGVDHCIAVTLNGQVATWGYGGSGVLGHGNYVSYTKPKIVLAGLQTKFIVYCESGSYHNGVVSNDGQLYMWGRADAGQLGIDQEFLQTDSIGKVCLQPIHLTYFSKQNRRIKQIALGEAHSLVLDEFGTVYSFGWSELGQLGIKEQHRNSQPDFRIHKLSIPKCQQISAGSISSYAVCDSSLFAWGSNQNGQLGVGSSKEIEIDEPRQVKLNGRVSNICAGESVIAIQLDNYERVCSGRGYSHQDNSDSVEIVYFRPVKLHSYETDFKYLIEQDKLGVTYLEPIISMSNEEDFQSSQLIKVHSQSSSSMNPLSMTGKMHQSLLRSTTENQVINVDLFDDVEVALVDSSQISNLQQTADQFLKSIQGSDTQQTLKGSNQNTVHNKSLKIDNSFRGVKSGNGAPKRPTTSTESRVRSQQSDTGLQKLRSKR